MGYKPSISAALFYSTLTFAAATLPFYTRPLVAFAEPTYHSRLNQKVSEIINILRAGKEFRQFECETHWMGLVENEATIYA